MIMNWYKKGKLIDKRAPTDESPATIACMYCGRWATHPENESAIREEYIWKRPEELDFDENHEAKKTLITGDVSSAICPSCDEILKEHNYNISPSRVKELSFKNLDNKYAQSNNLNELPSD